MNAPGPKALFETICALPDERIAEIEAFVDFIAARERDMALTRAAGSTAAPAFSQVWDDPENDVYDAL
ncbi:MAG: toxin-antitoxin system, antitoxin component, Xre family protein [Brevundimonas sp.]|nr:toxin-antitoxin system, antitoxin component, Xre family protein [Brevundimonas sp.]